MRSVASRIVSSCVVVAFSLGPALLAEPGVAVDRRAAAGAPPDGLSPAAWGRIVRQIDGSDAGAAPETGATLTSAYVTKLTAPDAAADGRFGFSAAISGDTVVVNAPGQSSTYVFESNAGGADHWDHVRTVPHGGRAVAIDGDTFVVGVTAFRFGWVYVYERNAGGENNWGQVAELVGPQPRQRFFAWSVAISGDTLVVGEWGTRAARVYERDAGGANAWGQTATLYPTVYESPSYFGYTVSIDGDTIVVGDPAVDLNAGAAYVFGRSGGTWSEQARLTAANPTWQNTFSLGVSVHGDTVVVGEPGGDDAVEDGGSVHVFARNAGGADTWGEVAVLTAWDALPGTGMGNSVAVRGDRIVAGAWVHDAAGDDAGAAYVFARNAGGADAWGQVALLTAPDAAPGDRFGGAVALDGDRIVVGAYHDDDAGEDSGSAHLFAISGCEWVEMAQPPASDAAEGDTVGSAVAMSGDTLVVGARHDDELGEDAGAAYVFGRNVGGDDHWGQVARLTASDGAAGDAFGASVAIDRGTVVVGATNDDDGGAFSGSAYVFGRNDDGADAWGETAKLRAADAARGDSFGGSVGISGATIVVGAAFADGDADADADAMDAGAAYVFHRDADDWEQLVRLTAEDGAAGDGFGNAVAIDGATIVVGAEFADPSGDASGAAYVFVRDADGGGWTQADKLVAADTEAFDQFGGAVAVRGGTVVAGASRDDDAGALSGAAYVFARGLDAVEGDVWREVRRLRAADATSFALFGFSVALDRDRVVVGAQWDREAGADAGAAYVFERNAGGADNWGQVSKLIGANTASSDALGRSVTISGSTIGVGAPLHPTTGAAYVFRLEGCPCGNGVLDPGEACDDGALIDGDGCSAACTIEACADADGDGFGVLGRPACPGGEARDCLDVDPTVFPGAPEQCDGLATDCDRTEWPATPVEEVDNDGDGLAECEGDCNDGNRNTFPGAPQVCDQENNDCDDPAWPAPPADDVDADGDGFSLCNRECDDDDPTTFPGALFVCDGVNNNCDDFVWPEVRSSEVDDDGDGFWECQGDCDDTDPNAYPAAPEICNGVDDDCNGLVDDDGLDEDTDLDGRFNACDNCPATSNVAQTDRDDDDEGDACDLDDGVIYFVIASSSVVDWHAETGYEAWNLYRGDLATLVAEGRYTQEPGTQPLADRECGRLEPFVEDPLVPRLKEVAFYLVTGVAGGVEGDLGTNSSGGPRPNGAPCP